MVPHEDRDGEEGEEGDEEEVGEEEEFSQKSLLLLPVGGSEASATFPRSERRSG